MHNQGFMRVYENCNDDIVIGYATDTNKERLSPRLEVDCIAMTKSDALILADAIHSLWEADEDWK